MLGSCKTVSPHVAPVLAAPEESSQEQLTLQALSKTTLSDDEICSAIRGDDSFPDDKVESQVQWLCQRGGLQALRSNSYSGKGPVNVTEYFAEHDKTMYYGAGFASPGVVDRAIVGGAMFCQDFEGLRQRVGNRGFESIKTVMVTVMDEHSCEYLQAGVSEWGLNPDLKAERVFGQFADSSVHWRVESLVVPLNYSPVKQFSALFLVWPEQDGVRGVYLTRSQTQVGGVLMSSTRSRWKSAVAGTIEATTMLLK
jgi:hypothetical protein